MADQSVSFNADVYCIYEDKDHNIWMGTREDGLFLFRFQGEDNYQVTCYLPDKIILTAFLPSLYSLFCKIRLEEYGLALSVEVSIWLSLLPQEEI